MHLNKLKSAIEHGTEVPLNIPSNIIDDSNDENTYIITYKNTLRMKIHILYKNILLLTNTQVSKLCKTFSNYSSANIKLSKTQLSYIEQPGGFLGRLLGPLLKTEFPLIGNVLTPLAKSV